MIETTDDWGQRITAHTGRGEQADRQMAENMVRDNEQAHWEYEASQRITAALNEIQHMPAEYQAEQAERLRREEIHQRRSALARHRTQSRTPGRGLER